MTADNAHVACHARLHGIAAKSCETCRREVPVLTHSDATGTGHSARGAHELLPRCFVGAKQNKKRIRFFSSSACFSPDIARLFRFNYKFATFLKPY